MNLEMYYVYMLKCFRGKKFWIYTGYAKDVQDRLHLHKIGKGAKFTRSFNGNLELVYIEEHRTKRSAMQRELEIKSFTRTKKIELIYSK